MSIQPPEGGRKADADAYLGAVLAERYRIIRQIGRGGMGVVYLGEHVLLEKKVAIKLLSEDFAKNPELVERFIQEARAASRIGHENIVDVVDCGLTPSGTAYFVMELLAGKDLAQTVRSEGRMIFERARDIALQICSALQAAHDKNIIHRDLKSENIFLTSRHGKDVVKILDFGIAKMQTIEDGDTRLTRAGVVLGTPEYMAPEQAKGERADHRVDIYALGCLLYEMLTGSPPFRAETVMGILAKHLFEAPEPPSLRVRGAVPRDVEQIILKALSKKPEQRFQSMMEMGEALMVASEKISQPPPEPVEKEKSGPKRHSTRPGVGQGTPPLVELRAALERDTLEVALAAAERAVEAAGGVNAPDLLPHAALLDKLYRRALGDLSRSLVVADVHGGLDPRAAFLLSRIDASLSIEDLLDVSGMPRLEAMRLLTMLLRSGVLAVE